MQELEQAIDGVTLKSHPMNLGKGAAIKTGLQTAMEAGFSHALQIDADGQHNIDYEFEKKPSTKNCKWCEFKTKPELCDRRI